MSPQPSELYFNYMMIYSYERTVDGVKEKKEFEFYLNPESQILMWLPHFEMVNAVISTPDGEVYSFTETLHDGPQALLTRFNPEKSNRHLSVAEIQLIKDFKVNFDAFDFSCSRYNIVHEFDKEKNIIKTANNFPLKNANQLYALTQLTEHDANLPVSFDYTNILFDNEFLISSDIEANWGSEKLELFGITPTMYYFETAKYKFYEKTDSGFETVQNPFLNQKHPNYFQ